MNCIQNMRPTTPAQLSRLAFSGQWARNTSLIVSWIVDIILYHLVHVYMKSIDIKITLRSATFTVIIIIMGLSLRDLTVMSVGTRWKTER